MPTQHGIQDGPADTRRISPVAFLLLTERIVRGARTAQAAAIGDAVAAAIVAAIRAVRLLPSVFRDAFVLRDTLMPARQRSRTRHHNHAQ